MIDTVMEALDKIADEDNTLMVKLLKYSHPHSLVTQVCNKLGLEEWEYGTEVFNALRDIVKLVFSHQLYKLPFVENWDLVPARKE